MFVGPYAEYWHRERTALLAAVQGRPGPGADDLTAFAALGWWVSRRVFGAQAEKCVLADDMTVIRAAWALAEAAPTG